MPLREITELRRVQKSVEIVNQGAWTHGGLAGEDDLVFQMTLLDVGEKRALVERILRALAEARPAEG